MSTVCLDACTFSKFGSSTKENPLWLKAYCFPIVSALPFYWILKLFILVDYFGPRTVIYIREEQHYVCLSKSTNCTDCRKLWQRVAALKTKWFDTERNCELTVHFQCLQVNAIGAAQMGGWLWTTLWVSPNLWTRTITATSPLLTKTSTHWDNLGAKPKALYAHGNKRDRVCSNRLQLQTPGRQSRVRSWINDAPAYGEQVCTAINCQPLEQKGTWPKPKGLWQSKTWG